MKLRNIRAFMLWVGVLVSRAGFTPGLHAAAARTPAVRLVELAELVW